MNLLNKMGETYESLWKLIIRPERNTYPHKELGPEVFRIEGRQVKRIDFQLTNPRGLVFYGSHWIPLDRSEYPAVVYMHGNSSNRLQGMEYLNQIISEGMSLVTFDFSGCGNSEGDYISLGWFEWYDLATVVSYLRKKQQVREIGIWGRSMGAVTALMYLPKDPKIKAAVFDSPFKSLKELIQQLCKKNSKVPLFILQGAVKIISKTIKEKAKFDIYDLNPLKTEVPMIATPGFFVVAKQDELINPSHTQQIYNTFKAKKYLSVVEGDHNSVRPDKCVKDIIKFLRHYLKPKKEELEVEVIDEQINQVQAEKVNFFEDRAETLLDNDDDETSDNFAEEEFREYAERMMQEEENQTENHTNTTKRSAGNLQSIDFFATGSHPPFMVETAAKPPVAQKNQSSFSFGSLLNSLNAFVTVAKDSKEPILDNTTVSKTNNKPTPVNKPVSEVASYNPYQKQIQSTYIPENTKNRQKMLDSRIQKAAKLHKEASQAKEFSGLKTQLANNLAQWAFL